jgi:hypothetical protein
LTEDVLLALTQDRVKYCAGESRRGRKPVRRPDRYISEYLGSSGAFDRSITVQHRTAPLGVPAPFRSRRRIWQITLEGVSPRPALGSDTDLVDPFERRRWAEGRLVTRREALAQAVTGRAVELVMSSLDVNALLDGVDLNAVLDQVDIDRVLDRIDLDRLVGRMDLNEVVRHLDVDALIQQTDLGAVIAASSSGAAADVLDAVRSQAVGLDEFIARWMGRLRRRPYTGPPGPPGPADRPQPGAGS